MSPETQERLVTVFGGLILGERSGWTAMFESSFLMPFWTRRKRREMSAQQDTDHLLSVQLPFALNQPSGPLRSGPGPRAEWFVFQLQVLLEGDENTGFALEPAIAAWQRLAVHESPPRLTLSQRAALANLQAGKQPPITGHDNPHYFDDGACFRSLAIATFYAEDLDAALEAVRQDASISNAEDGVWGAQAIAAALVSAFQGADAAVCVAAALEQLPSGSWIAETVTRALACASENPTVFELAASLEEAIVNVAYNYGDAAPETVPAVLATLLATRGDAEKALLAALALPRLSASLAPLLGALCGALGTAPELGSALVHHPLRGVALPFLAGTTLFDLLPGRSGEGTPHGSHTL